MCTLQHWKVQLCRFDERLKFFQRKTGSAFLLSNNNLHYPLPNSFLPTVQLVRSIRWIKWITRYLCQVCLQTLNKTCFVQDPDEKVRKEITALLFYIWVRILENILNYHKQSCWRNGRSIAILTQFFFNKQISFLHFGVSQIWWDYSRIPSQDQQNS